jgi:hypothetical protein
MKKNLFLFVGLIVMLSSCSPRVSTAITKQYSPLEPQEDVLVFGAQDPQPQDAEFLGIVRIGSAMTSTKCDIYLVLLRAMSEARKIGGNALKLTQHIPNGNGCHQISANILRINNPQDYSFTTIPDYADYALLHLYRPIGSGAAVNYDLHLDTSVIARVNNNWRKIVRIEKEGPYSLWARTEQKVELPLNIKFGNEYYVRCAVTSGLLVGRPQLSLVDNSFGRVEFQSVTTQINYITAGDASNEITRFVFPRFRFAVSGGLSARTASLPPDINPDQRAYMRGLMTGFGYDLGFTYYWLETFGVGLKYNEFRSSNEFEGYITSQGGYPQLGTLSEKVCINFVGPSFGYRFFNREKKNCFLLDFAIGYVGYQNKGTILSENITLSGGTVGTYLGFGYDIRLSATTSLGFQIAMTGGVLNEITETIGSSRRTYKLEDGQREGLGRIDFSVGLRF